MNFWRNFLKIFFILILGIIGGGIFGILILPKLIENPYFEKFQFTEVFKKEVIVNPKEEIIIQENTALKNAVEKAEKAVLTGSVLILTSDGLAVTLNENLNLQSEIYYQGELLSFQILKRSKEDNLVLIKVEKSNLPTVSFADEEKLKLGERVFLVGKIFIPAAPQGEPRQGWENETQIIVNEGIIKSFDDKFIETNIFENEALQGCPLFDIEGNIVGLNIIKKGKEVKTIPISKIREFTGL